MAGSPPVPVVAAPFWRGPRGGRSKSSGVTRDGVGQSRHCFPILDLPGWPDLADGIDVVVCLDCFPHLPLLSPALLRLPGSPASVSSSPTPRRDDGADPLSQRLAGARPGLA